MPVTSRLAPPKNRCSMPARNKRPLGIWTRKHGAMTRDDTSPVDRPLRIEPVTKMTDEVRDLLEISDEVRQKYGDRGSGKGPNLYGMMAHNPKLLRLFKPLNSFFGLDGLRPARGRATALLRTRTLSTLT